MNTWPIALSTGCFYDRPILDVLDAVCKAGFREIEVCSFPAHLDYHQQTDVLNARERMQRLGLRPVSFHAPFASHIDITAADDAAREWATEELLKACDAAALMGCRHVVLHPGPEREGRPPPEQFLQIMHRASEALNQVAARCCELELSLLLENMLPHLLFGHVRDMLYLLGEITTCSVGACLDTGHAHLAGEMAVVIQKLSSHLKLVHVNDNCGDRDAHLAPGEGTIDWPSVITELRRNKFHGTLVLELARREHEPIEEALKHATNARKTLEELCSK